MGPSSVSASDLPATLQQYLQKMFQGAFSVREIKSALEMNRCCVNHEIERFGSRRLASGDTITVFPFTKEDVAPKRFRLDPARVLYEDEALFAYDKPAGIASIEDGLFELLKKKIGELYPLHRLDKDTSGVLIFAKTKEAENSLLDAFRKRRLTKRYLAIVKGSLKTKQGVIVSHLGKVGSFHGQTVMGAVPKTQGQLAETAWQVLCEGKGASLLVLEPKTGRTHQIRTHMAALAHPLIGDVQYGWRRPELFCPKRFLLHARSLALSLNGSTPALKIEAPLPQDFENALNVFFGSVWKKESAI